MNKITFKQSYKYLPIEIKKYIKDNYILDHAVYSVEWKNETQLRELINLCKKYNIDYEVN